MKFISLIRHANSEYASDISDYHRVLNTKGINDAKKTGNYISKNLPKPDLIISSSAYRAAKTSEIIATEIKYDVNNIIFLEMLYQCGISEYIEVLNKQNNINNHIFIVSHNPGTTRFSSFIINQPIYTLPTCSVVHIKLEITDWNNISSGIGKIIKIITPKDL